MSTKLAILGGKPAVPSGPPLGVHAYDGRSRAAMLKVADGPLSDSGGPNASACLRLEQAACTFTGIRHAVAVPNATRGMVLGLRALGLGPGDEVLCSAYDWLSSGMSVQEVGATPVYVDIDPRTLHISPTEAEKLITASTRAVIVTHVHGTAADMGPWLDLAERHRLFLIEDPAQSLGATWNGRATGGIGWFGNYSFNWKKLVRTGDGGVLVTRSEALRDAVRSATNFGQEWARPPGYGETASHYADFGGGNERLNAMAAAAAAEQFGQLPDLLSTAERNASILGAIGDIPGFSLPEIPEGSTSTHHLFRILLDPGALGWDESDPDADADCRDRIVRALMAEGVPAGYWGFIPLSDHAAFRHEGPAWRTISPDTRRLRPVDPESMPVTRRMLRTSFVIGRTPADLQGMTEETARLYVEAFRKVADHMATVRTSPKIRPLTLWPPVRHH